MASHMAPPEQQGSCPAATWIPTLVRNPIRTVPGQEIRQEPEPGQPGQQQQPAREQGHEPGQPDVLRRASGRQPGEGRADYGRSGGVRGDDDMAR